MGQLFTAILSKLTSLASWLIELVRSVFLDVWEMIVDGTCYLFDSILSFAINAANELDITELTQYSSLWGSLPDGTKEVLGAIGFVPAVAIIFAAILIRITLQLVPFTRLGS